MKLKHDKLKNMTTLCMMSDTIVVTAHNDGTMAIWDTTRDDPLLRSWSAHGVEPYYKTASITTLLKINNKTVASGGYDCHIILWDIEREECVKHLQDSGYITGLQIKAEGQLVSSSVYNSNRSNTVRVWDYHSGNCIATFVPDGKILGVNAGQHWRYPTNTIVLPDQRIAFTTYNEALGGRAIVIWDSVKQSHECYPVKHQSRIDGLTAIPESDDFFTLASISSDMTLMQWPVLPFEMNIKKVNHSGVLRAFNDGTIVCLGSDQVSIYSAIGKLLTNFNVKSAYFPFPDNVKDCHDIWIKLADDCLFKVNLKELLTFTAEQGRNIHHYLLTRNDYRVLQAYYSCVTNKINLNEIINAAGDTILHMAARGRNWRYTKLLLDYSDEKDISKAGLTENKAGETPYSIASSYPLMKNIFLRYPVIQNIENKKALAELVKQISQLTSECNNLLEQNNKIKTEMGRLEMALRDAQLAEKAEKDARLKEEIDLNQLRSEMVSLKEQLKKTELELQKLQKSSRESNIKKELDQLKKSPLDVLLLFSAEKGESERVKHLLALDANINARNEDGETPLLLSMQNSHREVVEYLLTKKPDLTAVDAQGNSIIENMAIAANVEMLNLIIEHHSKAEGIAFLIGAYHKAHRIKTADEYAHIRKILSTNMLKIAVKQGNLESTKRAIDEFKAEIDAQDVSLETALHKAAYLSHVKIVEYLLDAGANTDVQDKHGQTATQVACGENKADIIRLIRHYEILRCVRKCDKDELEKLIGLYADQGLNNYYIFESRNLLVAALRLTRLFAESKRNEILELLLTNGMNVNTVTGNTTPLHIAVELSDKDPIKLLIKAGAMKENKNSAGQTVIEFARASGKADLADYLIEQFAKVKTKKKHGIVSGLSFTTFSKVDDGKQHTSAATGEGKKSTLAPK